MGTCSNNYYFNGRIINNTNRNIMYSVSQQYMKFTKLTDEDKLARSHINGAISEA